MKWSSSTLIILLIAAFESLWLQDASVSAAPFLDALDNFDDHWNNFNDRLNSKLNFTDPKKSGKQINYFGSQTYQNDIVYVSNDEKKVKFGSHDVFIGNSYTSDSNVINNLGPVVVQKNFVYHGKKENVQFGASSIQAGNSHPGKNDNIYPKVIQNNIQINPENIKNDSVLETDVKPSDKQIRSNFVIGENGSIPGPQVNAGFELKETNNDLAITDMGKLIVVPDARAQPEPVIVPGLNGTEVRKLLNLTPYQYNAMVIINLRKSLSTLEGYCERMSQLVDRSVIQKNMNSENARESYIRNHHSKRMWYSELRLYWIDVFSYQKDMDELMNKIRINDSISDSEVSEARKTMIDLLKSYKELTRHSQEVLNSSY